MSGQKILAIVLLVGGILGLAYGGFSYTKDETAASIGPIDIEVESKERVNIPMWAGVLGVVLGGVLLMAPGKKA
jgi:hypothetical protein